MGGRVESLAKGWWQADLGRGPVRWGFEASYTAPEKWIETFEADGLKKGKKKCEHLEVADDAEGTFGRQALDKSLLLCP